MTVAELIEELKKHDPALEVIADCITAVGDEVVRVRVETGRKRKVVIVIGD